MSVAKRRWTLLCLLYAALIAGWLGFARWRAPAYVLEAYEGRSLPSFNRMARGTGIVPPLDRVLETWNNFSNAVALAAALHLGVILFIARLNQRAGVPASGTGRRAGRWMDGLLVLIALAFYALTVWKGVIQDYYFYMDMWREVWRGHDPWFMIHGAFGHYPMNAYGPLFNVLAFPAWAIPLFPKLIFASAYLWFAIWLIKTQAPDGGSGPRSLALLAWLFIPYVWVEVPVFGHFDVLVALCCVTAVAARVGGRDIASGLWAAVGVLVKLMPIVLLPFLILDGRRFRFRLLAAAVGGIAAGFLASLLIWGPSTFRPVLFAAGRGSHHLSIFRFLNGLNSPIRMIGIRENVDILAAPIMLLGLYRAWHWSRTNQVDPRTSAVLAILVMLMFYTVGFPQYQMVLYVLATCWLTAPGLPLRNRPLAWTALACHFAWLSVFDVIETLVSIDAYQMQDWIGLPTFLLECFLAFAIISTLPRPSAGEGLGSDPLDSSVSERVEPSPAS